MLPSSAATSASRAADATCPASVAPRVVARCSAGVLTVAATGGEPDGYAERMTRTRRSRCSVGTWYPYSSTGSRPSSRRSSRPPPPRNAASATPSSATLASSSCIRSTMRVPKWASKGLASASSGLAVAATSRKPRSASRLTSNSNAGASSPRTVNSGTTSTRSARACRASRPLISSISSPGSPATPSSTALRSTSSAGLFVSRVGAEPSAFIT